MWSHYAASNTGICIEYDFNLAKIKNTIKNAIFPIAYSKQPINISDLLQDKKEKIFKHSIDAHYYVLLLTRLIFGTTSMNGVG